MKDTEKIEALLNDYCDRIEAAHEKRIDWFALHRELDGACKMANLLGYSTAYDPLENRFTVELKGADPDDLP